MIETSYSQIEISNCRNLFLKYTGPILYYPPQPSLQLMIFFSFSSISLLYAGLLFHRPVICPRVSYRACGQKLFLILLKKVWTGTCRQRPTKPRPKAQLQLKRMHLFLPLRKLRRSWHYASPPFAVVAPLANNDSRDFAKNLHNSYFSSVFIFFTKL